MPMTPPRSPLPTHSTPRSSPRPSIIPSISFSSTSPSAVREKIALSYPRQSSSRIRPFTSITLHISNRTITLPVLTLLHPRPSLRESGPSPFRLFLAFAGTVVLGFISLILVLALVVPKHRRAHPFSGEPDTRVFSYEEIRRVWEWEIGSGRYPSERRVEGALWDLEGQAEPLKIENPALPKRSAEEERREREVKVEVRRRLREQGKKEDEQVGPAITPVGHPRSYLAIDEHRLLEAYPRRPVRGSTLDLDRVMERCDFSLGMYVRDCLEVLRLNGGLDVGVRRGDMDHWRATFFPADAPRIEGAKDEAKKALLEAQEADMTRLLGSARFHSLLATRRQLTLAPSSSIAHPSHPTADPSCDPAYPRIFHIFWAGPFTDKPYAAALSFLYSQRLALDRPLGSDLDPTLCRPQMWIWINPGPASSLPDPRAEEKMKAELRANPWSSPLLHRRFEESVKFRLWNTSEQLDGVREMDGWREMRLFNSGGVKYGSEVPKPKGGIKVQRDEAPPAETTADPILDESDTSADRVVVAVDDALNATLTNVTTPVPRDELFSRVGSTSASGYDRLSVVLSDMARFVLTHRFGGVYLDADNLLLRDWEELWGWHGAFAYRWSRLEKYNTAVLKMQRGSSLGNFIFRTAVANGLDFHPMTVSRYLKDAGLEGLLLRLPDALFDPAWLNTEYYQRDRPPFPYFKRFEEFFETPGEGSAAPTALGIDGFFKGSFGYHYHNQWWSAFDPSRNFPDLGPRFSAGERIARGRIVAAKLAALPASRTATPSPTANGPSPTAPEPLIPGLPTGVAVLARENPDGSRWGDDESDFEQLDWSGEGVEEDQRDLSWATVVKRTYEAFVRGDRPNQYGEWIGWEVHHPTEEEEY